MADLVTCPCLIHTRRPVVCKWYSGVQAAGCLKHGFAPGLMVYVHTLHILQASHIFLIDAETLRLRMGPRSIPPLHLRSTRWGALLTNTPALGIPDDTFG